MRFFELVDAYGIAYYRFDDEAEIMYWWNEEDAQWEPSWAFEYPKDGVIYALNFAAQGEAASWREVEASYVG